MKILRFCFIIACLLINYNVFAQRTDANLPNAKFLRDTIKLGEPVRLSVVWKHLPEKEVFFPDSLYDFKPFEFVSKSGFPTRTAGLSTDSVIYELTSFETDTTLKFSLPIFILNEKDTTIIRTNEVEIFIESTIPVKIDSLRIIENTELQVVTDSFNYWYWVFGALFLIVLVSVLFYIFGGRIRKNFRLGRMRKQYQRFLNEFDKALNKYQELTATEQGLSLWKSYLENLQNIPFTTYTSKEIADLVPDKTLTESLKNIDRAIYGNRINEQTKEALLILKTYAENIYATKIKEIQNV